MKLMLATALLVVLPTTLRCASVAGVLCENKRREFTEDEKCAAKDMLLGWLSVTKTIAERAEAVIQNATKVKEEVNNVLVKAQMAITEYRDLFNVLNSTARQEAAANVHQATVAAERAIELAKSSEFKALSASHNAKESREKVINNYGSISIVIGRFSHYERHAYLEYEELSGRLEKITVHKNCTGRYNISVRLREHAEQLGTSVQINEWKKNMTELLASTIKEVKMEKCSNIVRNNLESLQTIDEGVVGAADKFNEAVQSFVAARLAVEGARETADGAMRNVTSVNDTIFNSFVQDANSLCELLRRHATAELQVGKVRQHFRRLMIISSDATAQVSKARSKIGGTVRSVLSVLNNITALPTPGKISRMGVSQRAENTASVMRDIVVAEDTAKEAVENSASATASLSDIESLISRGEETLVGAKADLVHRLSESRISASALSHEECEASLLRMPGNSWKDALCRAVGLNATALRRTRNSLLELESKIKEIEAALTNVDKKLQHAFSSAKQAVHVEDKVLLRTKTALVDEFGAVMRGFCTAAHELRRVRLDTASIDEHALIQQGKFAAEATRIEATWSNTSEAPEIPQHVEEGFMVARKVLTALDRARRRSKAANEKVAGELCAAVQMSDGRDAAVYAVVQKFMRNICKNASVSHDEDVCDEGDVADVLQLLKDKVSSSSMLCASPILTQLSLLLAKINDQVAMAHQCVQKAAVGVDAATAAVEEAVKKARDAFSKQHCTPLYKQLLNTLGSAWRHIRTSA
ncbi:hypothetical protein ERJ75_000477700 [Trypanosoma vivax]|nr:hypothetical protein ERJ75_000477700 [Trypanosoma vivax]